MKSNHETGKYKSYRKRHCSGLFVLTVLLLLTGCGSTREPKTVLLPEKTSEEEQNTVLGEAQAAYTVRKIYTQDYDSGLYYGYTAFLPGCKEYQIHLLKQGGEGGLEEISLDYRYGFYETRYTISHELEEYLTLWWDDGSRFGSHLISAELSPDGRFLIYVRRNQTYTGEQLYLKDLENGEEVLLLDGDVMGCPGDQFQIMTAWDTEDSLLCYGFYPSDADVWWDAAGEGKGILHFMDLEKKQEVQLLNYYFTDPSKKAEDFYDTRLYVDRDGDALLTAIVSRMDDAQGVWVDVFTQKISKGNEELSQEPVYPNYMQCARNVILRLDAGENLCYGCDTDTDTGQGGIVIWDISTGIIMDSYLGAAVTDFLVLDEGETIITAEQPLNQPEQEICLYTKNENGFTGSLLYKGTVNIIRLQYDPVYHRLLAELGDIDMVNGDTLSAERGIVVLEFE